MPFKQISLIYIYVSISLNNYFYIISIIYRYVYPYVSLVVGLRVHLYNRIKHL